MCFWIHSELRFWISFLVLYSLSGASNRTYCVLGASWLKVKKYWVQFGTLLASSQDVFGYLGLKLRSLGISLAPSCSHLGGGLGVILARRCFKLWVLGPLGLQGGGALGHFVTISDPNVKNLFRHGLGLHGKMDLGPEGRPRFWQSGSRVWEPRVDIQECRED